MAGMAPVPSSRADQVLVFAFGFMFIFVFISIFMRRAWQRGLDKYGVTLKIVFEDDLRTKFVKSALNR